MSDVPIKLSKPLRKRTKPRKAFKMISGTLLRLRLSRARTRRLPQRLSTLSLRAHHIRQHRHPVAVLGPAGNWDRHRGAPRRTAQRLPNRAKAGPGVAPHTNDPPTCPVGGRDDGASGDAVSRQPGFRRPCPAPAESCSNRSTGARPAPLWWASAPGIGSTPKRGPLTNCHLDRNGRPPAPPHPRPRPPQQEFQPSRRSVP